MSSFPSTVSLSNTESLNRLSGASEKLRKLQLTKKEATTVSSTSIQRETSLSRLINIIPNDLNSEYEELTVTIRKSERGFGFELKNGILVVKVFPNTPAYHSGIQVGDIILKVNGTCVKSKESIEIQNMIHESNSFVSLHLQRRLPFTNATPSPFTSGTSSTISIKPRLDEIKPDLDESKQSNDSRLSDEGTNTEYDMETNENVNSNDNESDSETETDQDDSDENPISVAGTLAQSAESKLSQFINDSTDISRNLLKKHRKQHSMSDESLKNLNLNKTTSSVGATNSNNGSDRRRAIKKTRSSTNPKTFQTQSMSNISVNTLNHSVSDNDLDKQQQKNQRTTQDADENDLIDYKDDISYTSEDNLHETNGDKSIFDLSSYNDYKQLITKPINLSILLRYILGTENESPKNLYFCIFVDDLLSSNEKKETILRWSYELYTTFLDHNAPLKIKVNELLCKKIEDIFDRNPIENINQLKKLLEDVRQEAVEVVNNQLSRFKEIKTIGLANLFHGTDLSRMSSTIAKTEGDNMKAIIDGLQVYVNELGKEANSLGAEWNGSNESAHISALTSSFATFVKRFGLPVKYIGKHEIDKIPTFVNKKLKLKKNSSNSIRGHSLIDCSFLTVRSVCYRCNQPFWGIGYQGLICQKTKCEIKVHRHCVNAALIYDCHGSQKTIKTDYKEKLDSIQKMIFGPKKKDEETQSLFYPGTIADGLANTGDSTTPIPSNFPRNLPVKEAIKNFEMMNAQKPNPLILTSPTAARVNNFTSSGSSSPNQNENRHTSNNNSPDHLNSLKKDTNQHHQILPNKPPSNSTCLTSSSTNQTSREQACKRVGSLKVDVKKPKTNVARSKSDPEPEEIKNAISSSNPYSNRFAERFQIDSSSTIIDANESTSSSSTNPISNYNSYRTSPGQIYQSQTSSTSSTNTTNSTRQSWMQGSDMEVEEELPNITANITKDSLEQLTRKEIKTQEVINELIHTEQKHVRNLKIMKNHFYVPITINVLLTKEERDVLFPNLEEVLEIHSNFNKKLKQLRRESTIVPIKQLIDVILEQFKGEQGERFQSACAKFCENQSQAIKLLQLKLKNSDKFSQFITSAENHSICRKLHLKDFLPTEVQRLVKYRLLFNELSKTASDQDDINRLQECVEASSKISSYVNKAVTVCENRIRNDEISNRIDTREFDQYCLKSPQLSQYRFLDVRPRKLIYEGELEWRQNSSASVRLLTALLYEDILVFLEKSTDEKRRYILKPLNYTQNRSKQTFTPVIPLIWINSFSSMNEKRLFHIVAGNGQKDKDNKENKEKYPSPDRVLFIFAAKSGDDRNKWCNYLQELTGKQDQHNGTLNRQQSSVSSLSQSPSNSNLSNKSVSTLGTSVSSSTLNSNLTVPPISVNELTKSDNESKLSLRTSDFIQSNSVDPTLDEQLNENSKSIMRLLKERHIILNKMIGIETSIDENDINDLNLTNIDPTLEQSINLVNFSVRELNSVVNRIVNKDKQNKIIQSDKKDINTNEIQIIKNLLNLENFLVKLRYCLNEQQSNLKKEAEKCLPNLQLPLDEPKKISPNRPLRGQTLSVDSELVSSSVISSSSTNADLSEDEQINYYDEDNLNHDDLTHRSQSTGSDQTLIIMPNNSVITESVKLQKVKLSRKLEEEDSDEDEVHSNSILIKEYDQVEDEEYRTPENERETDSDIKLNNLISIKIKPNEDDSESSDYRVPTPPSSEPPSLPLNTHYESNTYNDLSDDEVKEYHVFNKDNFDEDDGEHSNA